MSQSKTPMERVEDETNQFRTSIPSESSLNIVSADFAKQLAQELTDCQAKFEWAIKNPIEFSDIVRFESDSYEEIIALISAAMSKGER